MTRSARVYLVRHGSTEYNNKHPGHSVGLNERIRGWKDIPLDAEGRAEADRIAKRISETTSARWVWSSPLCRARDTATAIAEAIGTAVVPEPWLMPWNLGQMAGRYLRDVGEELHTYPAEPDKAPPGGESFRNFTERYLGGLSNLLRLALTLGESLIAVTHTRCTQLTRAWISAGCPADFSYDLEAMNDYGREVQPGEDLVLEPRAAGAAILSGA